jgi:DNA modification methylase
VTAIVTRGDAAHLHLPDATVDLIVTSPPYFGLRSYQDGGVHYDGQIGAEATPAEYLDALIACTSEWMRVLKPSGSIFVVLGDKYSQRTAMRRSSHQDGLFPDRPELAKDWKASRAAGEARMPRENIIDPASGAYVPEKSLMMLPQRYAIRCIDELGLILRAEIVWAKPNGLPESVTDRVRRSHEQMFHFVKRPRYCSAVDEIHEAHVRQWGGKPNGGNTYAAMKPPGEKDANLVDATPNPLGRLPGSVWSIPTAPLQVPDWRGVEAGRVVRYFAGRTSRADADAWLRAGGARRRSVRPMADHFAAFPPELVRRIVLGWSPRGGTILDPFGGTGTSALVASVHGRVGISVDLSADYCRLARWRTTDEKQRAKVAGVKPKPRPNAPPLVPGQLNLFAEPTA